MYAGTFGDGEARNVEDLFATATELVPDVVREYDEQVSSVFAGALQPETSRRTGNFSPRALAQHLYAASYGIKHHSRSADDYAAHMKVAVHLVCHAIST